MNIEQATASYENHLIRMRETYVKKGIQFQVDRENYKPISSRLLISYNSENGSIILSHGLIYCNHLIATKKNGKIKNSIYGVLRWYSAKSIRREEVKIW